MFFAQSSPFLHSSISWCLVSSYALRLFTLIPPDRVILIFIYSGVAMMIHSRGANASDVELVFTQILQGFGGGLAAISAQVGAQASVPHADVAIITALVLLFTEIGGAVGNACGEFHRPIPTAFQRVYLISISVHRNSRCDLVEHDA